MVCQLPSGYHPSKDILSKLWSRRKQSSLARHAAEGVGAVTNAVPEETDAKGRDSCQERCGVADACSSHTGGDASAKRGRTGIDEGWADDDKGGEEDSCGLHFRRDF